MAFNQSKIMNTKLSEEVKLNLKLSFVAISFLALLSYILFYHEGVTERAMVPMFFVPLTYAYACLLNLLEDCINQLQKRKDEDLVMKVFLPMATIASIIVYCINKSYLETCIAITGVFVFSVIIEIIWAFTRKYFVQE